MKKHTIEILTLLLFVSIFNLYSTENPAAILEYFDDAWEISIYDFTGREIEDFDFGTKLLMGYGIETRDSFAELRLVPNGSIINLNPGTFIKLRELQGIKGTRQNSITHVTGKLRVVAARNGRDNYLIQTPSTALGVRGTDFIVEISPSEKTSVAVGEGVVDLYNPRTGLTMELTKGESAGAGRKTLSIMENETDNINRELEEFRFKSLKPEEVPRFDFEEYYNDFEYFRDMEREAYLEYFADDDFFDDYREYMEKFRDYYESEMDDFHALLEREKEAVRERDQEARDAYTNEMDAFQEYLKKSSP